MRDLLREVVSALEHHRDCVYCTLVETRGSTPQKAGASMLVFADGSQHGTLGGGCVEAEVKQKVLQHLNDNPKTEVFTFSLDNDYGWDDGLICGGRMRILAVPMTQSQPATLVASDHYYRTFHERTEQGKGCIEAIVIEDGHESPIGSHYLFDEKKNLLEQVSTEEIIPEAIVAHLPDLEQRPRAFVRQGIAFLPVLPRLTLLIVGAGHVGEAVAQLASQVDFDLWIIDDRERYANKERFPKADRLLIGDISQSLKQLAKEIKSSVYAIIVTRGHNHDEEALYHLAQTNAGYIGMIGSKRKIRLIFEDLLVKGITEEQLKRVHAPLGIDIGSQTVPEIAVSIVAELIASRNKGIENPSSTLSEIEAETT